MRRLAPLLALGAASAALGWLLTALGLPSAYLFAALLVGLAAALARPGTSQLPPFTFEIAQAITGVALGALIRSDSLSALGDAWLPVALGVAAAGVLVARAIRLPTPTLLGPLLLAGIVVLAVPGGEFSTPPLLRETAFALIGLQVGLRFTLATVRQVA